MIRLGRVYGGYMVDVQASNRKLVMRSERMLGKLTGRTEEEARRALEAAGGRVKTAVLVLRGLSPKEADEALEACGGNLRTALGDRKSTRPNYRHKCASRMPSSA